MIIDNYDMKDFTRHCPKTHILCVLASATGSSQHCVPSQKSPGRSLKAPTDGATHTSEHNESPADMQKLEKPVLQRQ